MLARELIPELGMAFVDRIPLIYLIFGALTLGLAPFVPEPHLAEKLRMLMAGQLRAPMDLFDLVLHGAPWLLLAWRLGRMARARGGW